MVVAIVLGGDFNLIGFAPAFSGWSSSVGLVYRPNDKYWPNASRHAGAAAYVPESVWQANPGTGLRTIRPTRTCERLPNASRSPRLGQNCHTRAITIVPRVCGQFALITEQVEVRLEDNAFLPGTVTVPGTSEVRWVNHGQTQHTIAGMGWFEPVEMNPGDEWIVAFALQNTYEYHCTIHPEEMRMQVIVTPAIPAGS